MDKLTNIKRDGEYPLCQDNLAILSANAELANLVLASLRLPSKSALVLNKNGISRSTNTDTYLYVTNQLDGEIIKLSSGIALLWSAYLNDSLAKITISSSNQSVTKADGTVISSVYQVRTAAVESCTATEAWKFYRLQDVLQRTMFEDLLATFDGNLQFSQGTGMSTVATPVLVSASNNLLEINDDRLRINLSIVLSASITNTSAVIRLPIARTGYYPVNAQCEYNNNIYPIIAYLEGGYLVFEVGKWMQSIGVAAGLIENLQVNVNGEVVL